VLTSAQALSYDYFIITLGAELAPGAMPGLSEGAHSYFALEEFPGFGYCNLEAGESVAGFAFGNFFGEPAPQVELRHIGNTGHWGKVLFEHWWLTPYGPRRCAASRWGRPALILASVS